MLPKVETLDKQLDSAVCSLWLGSVSSIERVVVFILRPLASKSFFGGCVGLGTESVGLRSGPRVEDVNVAFSSDLKDL